jgi:hypothetical protein
VMIASVALGAAMTPKAQPTPKPLSAPEVARRRHQGNRHASAADRSRIKCLQVVNDYNDPMTMYSVWDLGQLGVVRTIHTAPLTTPINRSTGIIPGVEHMF